MEHLFNQIKDWGKEKGIDNPITQFKKLAEEMLEAHEALFEFKGIDINKIDSFAYKVRMNHLIEELGDIGVVWIILCDMLRVDPIFALQLAHNKNKNRKGKTINGNFIKEEDLHDN